MMSVDQGSQPESTHFTLSFDPAAPKKCSVRGCSHPLDPGTNTKMCEACRGRHRIYASTKRARRKLEKAAALGMGKGGEHIDASEGASPSAGALSVLGTEHRGWSSTSGHSAPPTWDNTAIDPQLFAEPHSAVPSAGSMNHLMPFSQTFSYPPSSSSELAGALTLPASAASNSQMSVYVEQEEEEESSSGESGSDGEEHDVSAMLHDADDIHSLTVEGSGELRPCSVKGCRAMIPASYTFKMCPPCRVRYRTYGNTKRAKWKAEREAFDRELSELRVREDERRRMAGEKPLSESPEELRAWELSILDEEVPLPPEFALLGINPDGTSTNTHISAQTAAALMKMMDGERGKIIPDSPDNIHALPMPITLPARMCTVSHCHRLLPGVYRYKRCEQHRLQNRYHGRLKRAREIVAKVEGDEAVKDGEEGENGSGKQKLRKKKPRKEGKDAKKEGGEGGDGDGEQRKGADREEGGAEGGEGKLRNKDKSQRTNTLCHTDECHNLMMPGVRWRHCELCRAREREWKREKRELEESAKKEVERLREVVRLMEAGVIPTGTAAAAASGSGSSKEPQSQQGEKYGEGGAVTNGDVEDGHDQPPPMPENHASPASVTPVPDTRPALTTNSNPFFSLTSAYNSNDASGTFQSVFRANPDPDANPNPDASSNTTINAPPTISTFPANPNAALTSITNSNGDGCGEAKQAQVTSGTEAQMTFRAYEPYAKPQTASERLLALNPDLSLQVFKDLLLPQKERKANTGLVGPSSYHVYRSKPVEIAREPPVFVPTVPQTPEFVYQPPAKKQRVTPQPMQGDGDLAGADAGGGGSGVASGSGSGTSPMSTTMTPAPGPAVSNVPTPTASPPSTVIPRQRRSRVSRPAMSPPADAPPKPTRSYPTAPAPAPALAPQQSIPPYSYTQYTYPYYMSSPYGLQPSYPMPGRSSYSSSYTLPTSASSSSAATMYPPPPTNPYQYPYQPYGYPSYTPPQPLPGYGYLPPPRYTPGVGGVGAAGVTSYGMGMAPGYGYGYGYPQPAATLKDPASAYHRYTPGLATGAGEMQGEVGAGEKRKRKEDAGVTAGTGTVAVADSMQGIVGLGADRNGTTMGVAPQPPQPSLPSAPAPAITEPVQEESGTGIIVQQQQQQEEETQRQPPPCPPSQPPSETHPCGNKTCHRTIPSGVTGTLCEKCRLKLKKHQIKARQRFRLEPRKSVLSGSRRDESVASREDDSAGAEA